MTTTNQALNLNEVSPETLAKVLQAVMDHTAKTLANDPDPIYHSHCPLDSMAGNYDDTWEDGQDNGELLEAKRIQDLIHAALTAA